MTRWVMLDLVLLSYLLVQLDRIDTKGFLYSLTNGLGAALLCISLYINFNMSGLLIESSWLLISLYGLYRWVKKPSKNFADS